MLYETHCPHCSEVIKAEAVYCKHCRRRVHARPFLLPLVLIVAAAGAAFFAAQVFDWPGGSEATSHAAEPSSAGSENADREQEIQPPMMDFEQAQKTLLRIEAGRATGSGFLVSSSGHALTSAHVVGKNKKVLVQMRDGTSAEAKVVRRNEDGDMALLQIEADREFPFLDLEDATTLKSAQQVTVVGFPLGLETAVVTRGIVSAAPLYLPGLATPLIQIDASVNPGNSGGPLLNESNRVVGIVEAKLFGAESMNWVVPINYASRLRFASAKKLDSKPFRGWLQRGREKAEEDGSDGSRSPEQVFSSWGKAESINIEWVATLPKALQVFVSLLDESGEPMETATNIGITVRWENGSCLGMKDVEPSDFGERSFNLAKKYGYQGTIEALAGIRVSCPKLPSGSRIDISADFRESDIADHYTIQIK